MQRRQFISALIGSAALVVGTNRLIAADSTSSTSKIIMLDKPKKEWKLLLNPPQFDVLFKEATERPWSSALNDEKREGQYICAACYLPLFESVTKFDSGTGWPSFFQPIAGNIVTKTDFKLLFPRTEYHCARCGGHQGHVFSDGPEPTGERYCNNGVALIFIPEGEPLPELRS